MHSEATRLPSSNGRCSAVVGAALLMAMLCGGFAVRSARAENADLILHNGRIVTVDADFAIVEAMAVRGDRIIKVGGNAEVLKLRGERTEVVDLAGQMVLPGLIDSHVHPSDASLTEFDHEIPEMNSIADVLEHVRQRAKVVPPGKWIAVHQVFITRLAEQRYPTRAELDAAAPQNPVAFMTGPDVSLNSLALARCGIDKHFQVTGSGVVERYLTSDEPTGVMHGCNRYVKLESSERQPTEEQRLDRLRQLFKDYNSVGLTTVCDKAASSAAVGRYRELAAAGQLTVRMAVSRLIDTDGRLDAVEDAIRQVGADPLVKGDSRLWIVGIKTFLDGGMLTGSAYMQNPWGVSRIYSIRDPQYRGVRFIPQEQLVPIVETTVKSGLQFTAHAVGDGAVQALLDAYEDVNRRYPIRGTRPCITHSNFMSREAIDQAARLGIVLDIQPAWLLLDGKTLDDQFGVDRLRYFQPLKSIFAAGIIAGGGSDHMQKIGRRRSINFYDPFLAMQTTVARTPKGMSGPLHPEESLDRKQMIRFYTANNAYVLRREHDIGSLGAGKLADFIIVDTDLLNCDVDAIGNTKVLATYLGGKRLPELLPPPTHGPLKRETLR
jgi:predicted amidohydrolase YtcJ